MTRPLNRRAATRFVMPLIAELVTLSAVTGLAVAAQDPVDPAHSGLGWGLVSLDLDVTVRPDAAKIEVRGRAVLHLEGKTSFGPAIGINGETANMKVLSLESDPPAAGATLNEPSIEESPNTLVSQLRFDEPFERGDEITITFTYESIEQGSQFKASPTMAFASWTEAWHPIPLFDFKNVALSRGMASTGTTVFHLPAGWSAAAEGVLVSREESDAGVSETWRLDAPLARSFAAGPFTKANHAAEGREVNVFMLSPDLAERAEDQARILAKAMIAMESRFGPYPYPSYSIIEIPESMGVTWYAASQQGLIFARSGGFRYEGGNLPLFAHEMAHGWWGNLVGTDGPGSILCSESLAQYGAVVAIETLEGIDARDEFLRYSRTGYSGLQCANGFFYMWREGHDKPMRDLESGGWDHNLSDAKGHWVYHMLRHRVGDEIFFATLRGLIADFAGRPMTLDDMRAAFVSAAPELNIEGFFAQWLDRTGAPVLDVDWWAVENGKGVRIDIAQTQPGEPFHLDLEVVIEFLDGDRRTEVIQLREMTQTFRIDTEKRPVAIRLDPNLRHLIWRPEYGPRPGGQP